MAYRPKADRAKLFAPFDALKGFREALREKERIVVPKIELSEEMKEALDYKFSQVKPLDMVTVTYFSNGEYVQITGKVSKIYETSRILQIVTTKIFFDDILDIKGDSIFDYEIEA